MNHLTPENLSTFAQRLDSLKQAALRDLQTAGAPLELGAAARLHDVHGHADDAEAERVEETRDAEIEVDTARLHDIVLAQQRMTEGVYGTCVDCDEDIPLARLDAQPIAIRCARCQTEVERVQHR